MSNLTYFHRDADGAKSGAKSTYRPMKPIKIENVGWDCLKFPFLLSEKMDGIRVLINLESGMAYTSSMKPLVNLDISQAIEKLVRGCFNYRCFLEGEITIPGLSFNDLSGKVRSAKAPVEKFEIHLFDITLEDRKAVERQAILEEVVDSLDWKEENIFKVIPQIPVMEPEEVHLAFNRIIADGGEGVILKKPDGFYKNGRAGKVKQELIKIKGLQDAEAIVIGFEERLRNDNPIVKNAYGLSERSSHKENKTPANTLGCLVVEGKDGVVFSIGTGFSDGLRKEIWDNKEAYLGKMLTYTYMSAGVKDKPRHPVFKGFRSEDDQTTY